MKDVNVWTNRELSNQALLNAMIDDIAESLDKQLKDAARIGRNRHLSERQGEFRAELYTAAIRDDIIAMAIVIRKHAPWYDIDKFYTKAGYAGTHPVHS